MTKVPLTPKSIEIEKLVDKSTETVVNKLTKKVIAPTHIDFTLEEKIRSQQGIGLEVTTLWRKRINNNEYTFQPDNWDKVWTTKAFVKIWKPEGDTEIWFIVVSRRYDSYRMTTKEAQWAFTWNVIEKELGLEIPKQTKKPRVPQKNPIPEKKGHKIKKQEYLYQQAEASLL